MEKFLIHYYDVFLEEKAIVDIYANTAYEAVKKFTDRTTGCKNCKAYSETELIRMAFAICEMLNKS